MAKMLQPGEAYGPFEILELLGQGAFASVYRVRAPGHDRDCALKVSIDTAHDDAALRRTEREIAILRFLTNHHAVRIHDAGAGPDGRLFLLMEHLTGQQLDAYHDFDRPMRPATAVGIIQQACLGLAEAHSHGIVHRDLKPSNIWIESNLNVKVIDFGLARMWHGDSPMATNVTIGRILIGTPHYSQPEQLETHELTPASDIYSLGIILYELLTGRCPFFPDQAFSVTRDSLHNDPAPWFSAHRSTAVTPLHHYPHCRNLPQSLLDLVMQSLEKIPDLRPPNAGSMANQLGSILHYDFGAAVAAILRITHSYGGYEDRLVLPGSHRIGSDRKAEIRLRDRSLQSSHAILEWDGLPDFPQLRTLVHDGSVRLNDRIVDQRVEVQPGDRIVIGSYVLEMNYPDHCVRDELQRSG